mmetsp:Transcript_107328/g.167699  ORF Transcript_107328/g.167699 Transcript_107328/m.167699 type:complete len:489 (+) Transcript_107328:55-1521(+)
MIDGHCLCTFKSDDARPGLGTSKISATNLRFAVGDRVRCKTDESEWCIGTIVAASYHQADWEDDMIIPYQVEIDEGLLIYVPKDDDEICQQIPKAWWEVALHGSAHCGKKSMFDAPGRYLVVSNTMVQNQVDRSGAIKISDAKPPWCCDVVEVQICGDRVRGRVAEPSGWMSLRSVDNEKVFAVPAQSAYAYRFRLVNKKLFLDEVDTEEDSGLKSCLDPSCGFGYDSTSSSHTGLCLETLFQHSMGQDINECDERGQTVLLAGIKLGCIDTVQAILELRADINVSDIRGDTAIHHAVQRGEQFVHKLLQARVDPNVQTLNPERCGEQKSRSFETADLHQTPLHLAAKLGSPCITRALLLANANPNVRDAQSKVPLQVALDEEADAVVDMLLDQGADVNIEIGLKTTLLHDAVYRNDSSLVNKLLAARAALDVINRHEMTALHMAVRSRRDSIARLLIAAGCDTRVPFPGSGKASEENMQRLDALLSE